MRTVRPITTAAGIVAIVMSASCQGYIEKSAVKTTASILYKSQGALKQESDYDHAARALPGALKTIESFHYAYPEFWRLTSVVAEGYCQYGTGFTEDEWEDAKYIKKDFDQADYIARRATKFYLRCTNYALEWLGGDWAAKMNGPGDAFLAKLRGAGQGQRKAILLAAMGMGSAINMNLDDPDYIAMVSTVQDMLKRIVVMDGDGAMFVPTDPAKKKEWDQAAFDKRYGGKSGSPPADSVERAMPHVALGLMFSTVSEAVGGDPDQGKRHFERAIELTGGKFLLAKVFYARAYGRIRNNREFFRKTLVEVLQTNPAIYPEQRLANEIAHRRARRYLKLEKEWF
jgi:TRAP transporter TatT component family protein